jgi:acyl carrier protein
MDRQWIRSLLSGLLPEQTIQKVCDEYDEYKDVPLSELGLDSMAQMGLVINIEKAFGRQIDYEAFDLGDVSTLSRARDFLGAG